MLSQKDKEEMLADGNSNTRKEHFAAAQKKQEARNQDRSLDGYLEFLAAAQKIFPFSQNQKSKTNTTLNKL